MPIVEELGKVFKTPPMHERTQRQSKYEPTTGTYPDEIHKATHPMTPALDVVTFGEAMMLLVADRPGPLEQAEMFYKRTAGAETNVAIGLARLGLRVGWASRLGTDSMGRYLLAALAKEGVDCSHVVCDAGQSTGFQLKGQVTDGSDPEVEYHRKG